MIDLDCPTPVSLYQEIPVMQAIKVETILEMKQKRI